MAGDFPFDDACAARLPASSRAAGLREHKITLYPAAVHLSAKARPVPCEPPVIWKKKEKKEKCHKPLVKAEFRCPVKKQGLELFS
jgi:hypothetical protein